MEEQNEHKEVVGMGIFPLEVIVPSSLNSDVEKHFFKVSTGRLNSEVSSFLFEEQSAVTYIWCF